jgi:hypothetical protein
LLHEQPVKGSVQLQGSRGQARVCGPPAIS